MTVFDRYLEQAKDFTRKLVRAETGTRRWATVTAVDPVRITYDGTTTQGTIPPVVLGTPVTIGDRVRAHTIHDRTYITRANPTPHVDTDWANGSLSAGFTGTLKFRLVTGNLVEIAAIVDGSFPRGNTAVGSIPAEFAPTLVNARPGVYMVPRYVGVGYVTPTGAVGVTHEDTSSKTQAQIRGLWSLG